MKKIAILIFLLSFSLFSIEVSAQSAEDGFVTVTSGPGKVKRGKHIMVFNGIIVKDSLAAQNLSRQIEPYKVKKKYKVIHDDMVSELGLPYDPEKYVCIFALVTIKDIIIDPETLKVYNIKGLK